MRRKNQLRMETKITMNSFIRIISRLSPVPALMLAFSLSLYFVLIKSIDDLDVVWKMSLMLSVKGSRFLYMAVSGYLLYHFIKEKYTRIVFMSHSVFYTFMFIRVVYIAITDLMNYMDIASKAFWFGNIALLIIFLSTLIISESNARIYIKKAVGIRFISRINKHFTNIGCK